jgi:diadenosine tetraphosphate (Ap4A) HIT family hydrolase
MSPLPDSRPWSIDADWQDRVSGRSCAFCATAGAQIHGVKVADLRVSQWLLGRNQYVRGYSILILKFHAVELFTLSLQDRQDFVEDIAQASRALYTVCAPIKLNIEMQGNVIPHLHCHIKPRYVSDRPGHARIFQDQEVRFLQEEDYKTFVTRLREALP